ncbi:MAG: cytochrome b/b6 domain-containing protein [Dehalococcoidales bacterium]|jgi:Ni/Fe-hydrogenase 1 B-type cytochrome subunit
MASPQTEVKRHPTVFRILHSMIMFSILFLAVTGFYIHSPFIGGGGFLMALARGVHFFLAFILTVATILRIIWMFIGKNRDWRSFIPAWSDLKMLPRTIAFYTYISSKEPALKKKYNPLQMISYSFVLVLIVFQILSGFALQYPDGAFSWFNYGLFNSEVATRIAHFVATWLFVIFVMIHTYLAIRANFSEMKQMHLFSDDDKSSELSEGRSV